MTQPTARATAQIADYVRLSQALLRAVMGLDECLIAVVRIDDIRRGPRAFGVFVPHLFRRSSPEHRKAGKPAEVGVLRRLQGDHGQGVALLA